MPTIRTIPQDRTLSAQERQLIEWLMTNGVPEKREYESQMAQLRVVGQCNCGCPSVDLAVGEARKSTIGASHILADFMGRTPEGFQVGVILHAREGKISELEIYSIDGAEGSFQLPEIETLKPG